MASLISQFSSPYFEFLVVEKDECWERRGKVQRIVGIKAAYHHHPEALRLPDCVVSVFVMAFQLAHPKFNYHGYTMYEASQLDALLD